MFGHAGARTLVFPTRMGRFYDYENWRLLDWAREHVDRGWLQLYCLDSVDAESLYNASVSPVERIRRHNAYEGYILEEVLPLTRSLNPNPALLAHGCSIGAYHAVNLAFRHPHLFQKVVAFSGRYDLTTPMGWFPDLFGGFYNQDIYFHTPSHFIPNLADSCRLEALRRMEIILAVGEDDAFRWDNQRLSQALWDKGVWHALHVLPGEAHSPHHWRRWIRDYL